MKIEIDDVILEDGDHFVCYRERPDELAYSREELFRYIHHNVNSRITIKKLDAGLSPMYLE